MRQPNCRQIHGPSGGAAKWIAAGLLLLAASAPARAEIDGHGPDAWRVTGVAAGDRLNARMGPGTNFPVIDGFEAQERGLVQVTCVPYLTAGIHAALSAAELRALPPRWCLMRSADLIKAGWVAQRYITPDEGEDVGALSPGLEGAVAHSPSEARLQEGEALVQALYAALERAERGKAPDPLGASEAGRYFSQELRAHLRKGAAAHPLYGAQDFAGALTLIARDPAQPPQGESVVVVADFVNFGQPQKAAFTLTPDPSQPGRPLRIARIAHQGWALPE